MEEGLESGTSTTGTSFDDKNCHDKSSEKLFIFNVFIIKNRLGIIVILRSFKHLSSAILASQPTSNSDNLDDEFTTEASSKTHDYDQTSQY